MENLDLIAVTRMGLILAHLVAFAAAFAAVALGDFAIFYRRHVDVELLTKAANGVSLLLMALWITGFAIVWLDTQLDLASLMSKPKILAKLTIVTLLTANGLLLHRWVFPLLSQPQADPHQAAVLPAVLGGISATTWLYAVFLGVGGAVAPALGYSGFMTLYAASVALGVAISLAYVRPRLAVQMLLPEPAQAVPEMHTHPLPNSMGEGYLHDHGILPADIGPEPAVTTGRMGEALAGFIPKSANFSEPSPMPQ